MSQSLFEQIRLFLPQYLAEADQKKLYKDLESFPNNLGKMYGESLEFFAQGDGVFKVPYYDLPTKTLKDETSALLLSNTCDMAKENIRHIPMNVLYSPIIKLQKIEDLLNSKFPGDNERVKSTIEAIKRQKTTNIFYLPRGILKDESIVFLDKISSIDRDSLYTLNQQSIFSLSMYGFYLLLIKLGIHFCRVQEGDIR